MPDEIDLDPADLGTPRGAGELARSLGSRKGRHWGRTWTARDLDELRRVWGTKPDAEIAARFGRTVAACEVALWRWYGSKGSAKDDALTGRQVARILGLEDHHVSEILIPRKLLRASRGEKRGPNRRWRIHPESLERFLREHPEQYDPARVTGAYWRQIAIEAHAADPLLTLAEAARVAWLSPATLQARIKRGDLSAVWSHGGRVGSNRGWMVRQSDALATRDRGRRAPRFPERDRVFAEQNWATVEEAARVLGVNPSTARKWVREGRLPERRLRAHGKSFIGIPRSALGAGQEQSA